MDKLNKLKQPSAGTPLCGMVMSGVMCYFFAKYAFNPPSGNVQCWGSATEITTSPVEVPGQFETNVSHKFYLFFLMSFINVCIQIGVALLQTVAGALKSNGAYNALS